MQDKYPRSEFSEHVQLSKSRREFGDFEAEFFEAIEVYAFKQCEDNRYTLLNSGFYYHEGFKNLANSALASTVLDNAEKAELLATTYVKADADRVEFLRDIAPFGQYEDRDDDPALLMLGFETLVAIAKTNRIEAELVEFVGLSFIRGVRSDLRSLSIGLRSRSSY